MKSSPRMLVLAISLLGGAALVSAQTTTTPTTPTTTTTPTTPTPTTPVVRPTMPVTGGTTVTPTPPTGTTTVRPTTPVPPTPTTTPVPPTPTTTTGRPGNAGSHTPNVNASEMAKTVLTMVQGFDAAREKLMAERQALLDKLQAAKTDAERQAIIAQLRSETQAEKEQQAALGKQMREELKKLRDQRKAGGS